MKKIWLLIWWIILFAWVLTWCWKDSNNTWDFIIEDVTSKNEDFASYNDTLADLLTNCVNAENETLNSTDDENVSIETKKSAINNKIQKCQYSIEQISSLWDLEWDNSLQNEVIGIIEKITSYYSKLDELLTYSELEKPTDEETEIITSIMEELNSIDNEISESNNTLLEVQREFADRHGYPLEDE